MIINALHLRNYKQYAHLDLEFKEGLVGIIGKNGAGKSTLFDAILYCLFGREDGNKAFVRSAFADPKAAVELTLEFSLAGLRYQIRREFRGKQLTSSAEFFKNDALIAKGVSAVNDEVAKTLKMEREAFKRSVFSGQKELSELSDTTGEARKKMVRRMLGIDTLDEVQIKVNADIRDMNHQIVGQRQNLLDPQTLTLIAQEITAFQEEAAKTAIAFQSEKVALQSVQNQRLAQKKHFDEVEALRAQFTDLQKRLGQWQERLDNLLQHRQQLEAKREQLIQSAADLETRKQQFLDYEADRKALEQAEVQYQRKLNQDTYARQIQTLQPSLAQSKRTLANLEKALSETTIIEKQAIEKQAEIAALKVRREEKMEAYQGVEKQLAALDERIRERNVKLTSLQLIGKGGTCPTCFQPVLEAYDQVVTQLNADISNIEHQEKQQLIAQKEDIKTEGTLLKNQIAAAETAQEALKNQQARLTENAKQHRAEQYNLKKIEGQLVRLGLTMKEIGTVVFDEIEYQQLKTKVPTLEKQYLAFKSDENYISKELPLTLVSLKKNDGDLSEVRVQIAKGRVEIQQINFDTAIYEKAKIALTEYDGVLHQLTESVQHLEKESLGIQAEIAKRNEKKQLNDRILAQMSDKLSDIEVLDKLSKLIGQFKTDVLERVSPGISTEASTLFHRITKGKYERIEVDESFEFSIADEGVLYPISRFSGGEIDLANFCLRIAITKAIMELGGGQDLEFLAFDEIFGSQDEERRFEIMMALNYLQEQFRQIYIISHIENLKDFFPYLLEVQSGSNGSEVTWRG